MVGILETLVKAGAVFGLLALTVRLLRRVDGASARRRSAAVRNTRRLRTGRAERLLEVVERTGVGRSATVVVVRVAGEHWVLGVTDNGVNRLGEIDLEETDASVDGEADVRPDRGTGPGADPGPGTGRTVVDLRHPAAQWADRVRSLRDRFPERERAEDVDLPPVLGTAVVAERPAEQRAGRDEPVEPSAPVGAVDEVST